MSTENDFLDDILTPEEKEYLGVIEAKIQNKIRDLQKSKYDAIDNDEPLDLEELHPELGPPRHITSSPHEIRVYVNIETSTVNEKGYIDELKDITKKSYHIPVPPEKNYEEFIDKFVQYFETKLTETCKDMIPPIKTDA